MAFAPCTAHGGGFKGAASTFFPALVQRGERRSVRHKACPVCADEFVEWADAHLSLVSVGDEFYPQAQQFSCCECGGDLSDDSWAFFLSEYYRGRPERQLYGQVCARCVGKVAETWQIQA